jgi:hypothetical protein
MHGGRGVTKIRDVKIRRRHGASALLLFPENDFAFVFSIEQPPYPFIYF